MSQVLSFSKTYYENFKPKPVCFRTGSALLPSDIAPTVYFGPVRPIPCTAYSVQACLYSLLCLQHSFRRSVAWDPGSVLYEIMPLQLHAKFSSVPDNASERRLPTLPFYFRTRARQQFEMMSVRYLRIKFCFCPSFWLHLSWVLAVSPQVVRGLSTDLLLASSGLPPSEQTTSTKHKFPSSRPKTPLSRRNPLLLES
jgi:hypothetical protein